MWQTFLYFSSALEGIDAAVDVDVVHVVDVEVVVAAATVVLVVFVDIQASEGLANNWYDCYCDYYYGNYDDDGYGVCVS